MPVIFQLDIRDADIKSNNDIFYIQEQTKDQNAHNVLFLRTRDPFRVLWGDRTFVTNKLIVDEDIGQIKNLLDRNAIIIASLEGYTEELQKTHTNISKEISDTLATNQSKDNISDTLTNIIDTKYSQLNASMTGRIETMFSQFTATNNDILERVQPMKTVEEYFTNMNNSNKKTNWKVSLKPFFNLRNVDI